MTRTRTHGTVMVGLGALVLVCVASSTAATRTIRAQLDGDGAIERVERLETLAPTSEGPESSGCSDLRIVDGTRTQRLTPPTASYSSYCLYVMQLSVRDLTGDGRADIVWTTNITGGRANRIGVHTWNGRSARRIFTEIPGEIGGGRFSFLPTATVLPPRRGLRELKVRDAVHEASDALCCPTFIRTRRFRWNGRLLALVSGSTNLKRLKH